MLKHKVPYYLIGATATALRLLQKGIRPARGTKDIDFAIMLSSFEEYDVIKTDLMERGFNKVYLPWTLYHQKYKVAIDLLPFGQIEENDTEIFTERAVDIVVLGFKETMEEAGYIPLDETYSVSVPPLHGMCMLKLIAWNDRPELRDTDLEDIFNIVSAYFDLASEEIWAEDNDLFEGQDDLKLLSARVLGRKTATLLNKSEKLRNRILNILDANTLEINKSKIADHWARKFNLEVDYGIKVLNQFKTGVLERLK